MTEIVNTASGGVCINLYAIYATMNVLGKRIEDRKHVMCCRIIKYINVVLNSMNYDELTVFVISPRNDNKV